MSDTAKGWRMVADLLAANADRLPSPMRACEIANECLAEADRLDHKAARDTDVEEATRIWWASYADAPSYPLPSRPINERGLEAASIGVRAVIDHLADRLAPTGGMVLTADEAADVRILLEHARHLGHERAVAVRERLRARFAPAEKPQHRELDRCIHCGRHRNFCPDACAHKQHLRRTDREGRSHDHLHLLRRAARRPDHLRRRCDLWRLQRDCRGGRMSDKLLDLASGDVDNCPIRGRLTEWSGEHCRSCGYEWGTQ